MLAGFVVLNILAAAGVVVRRRRRALWVSPYEEMRRALDRVVRADPVAEQPSGVLLVERAHTGPDADVIDLTAVRAQRVAEVRALHPSASSR